MSTGEDPSMGGCLTEWELYRAYRRETSPSEASDVLRHVVICPLCQEQWRRFTVDEQVAAGIRSAVRGDLRGADRAPGIAAAVELPEQLSIPGFRLRGDFVDGGQARVFRATNLASQEEVAIKVFHNSALNEGGNARFSRELQSLARLRHPHVIPIRSAGETLGHAYYVMPWIEGEPLDEFARSHMLSRDQRIDLAGKICSAVDHAHKRGVMHLDLKPSNVRVDRTGEPVVMDFGLARLSSGEPGERPVVGLGAAGTPAYMAPEQVREPGDVDTRTDVFMVGLLLYEVFAGRRARAGKTDGMSLSITELASQPPRPIREASPRVDGELAAIVDMATAMDRDRRYQSAGALLDDLRRYRRRLAVRAMGDSLIYRARKFSRQHLAILVCVLAAAILVSGALIIRRETQRMASEAYGRAMQVGRGLHVATERQLGRAYRDLSELYQAAGDTERAQEYAVRAETTLKRAKATKVTKIDSGGVGDAAPVPSATSP